MKLEELVKDYIIKVTYLEGIERNEIELTLRELLEFDENFSITMEKLQNKIEDEYNVSFDGGCNSSGNKILGKLCDDMINSYKPKKQIR